MQHRHTAFDPDCEVCVANLPVADDYIDMLSEGVHGLMWAILKVFIGILIIIAALWLITLPVRAEVHAPCSPEMMNGPAGVAVATGCTAANARFRSAIAPTGHR